MACTQALVRTSSILINSELHLGPLRQIELGLYGKNSVSQAIYRPQKQI